MVILLFNFISNPIHLVNAHKTANYIQVYFTKYAVDGWAIKHYMGIPEYRDHPYIVHLSMDNWSQFNLIKHLGTEAVYKYFNVPDEYLLEII